jgi:uncharacterized membrane protein YfcA
VDSTLIVAMAIVAVAGTIFGMTGFGFALLSVPPLLLLYPPETVIALIFCVSLPISAIVVADARRDLDPRVLLSLLPGALVGLAIGVRILTWADPVILKLVAGVLVAGYSLLLLRGFQPRGAGGLPAAVAAGLASGALATSTGISGPPVIMLLTARRVAVHAFRVTTSAYFVFIDIVGLGALLAAGAVGRADLVAALALTPAALVGTLAGNRLVRRLDARQFRVLTLALLLLTGLSGMVTALAALR